jgi:cellulose synthase/poly-beta-1,6-N-acetylglucosamine synthase-like glycosyltransferase
MGDTLAVASRGARAGAPRVSVVIPAYNRAHIIGCTIESVRAQTFDQWELVVFDDGSTDETFDVARGYAERDPRINVGRGPNGGVAMARNRGFELSTACSEFVTFLDSDDLWDCDALETLVGVLDSHPEYVGVHALARCIDDAGRPIPGDDLEQLSRSRRGFRDGRLVAIDPHEPTTFGELVHHNWIVTPGTQLLRRTILARVGGFDPRTDPADDADLAIRVSRHGDIGFVDRSILQWRRHPETLTNTSSRWGTAALRVRAKTLTDLSNTPAQLQAMRMAYKQAVGEMLGEARSSGRRAVREAVRATNLYQAYVRANLTLWARRGVAAARRRRGAGPAITP